MRNLHTRKSLTILGAALSLTLVACGGGDSSSDSTAARDASETKVASGEELYGRCVPCHMANGEGMMGSFPPLAGSEIINGGVTRPVAVLLHGLTGPVTVKGATYEGNMFAYGAGVPMSDEEVAAVLTYVRSNFGNSASSVTAEDVARVRAATAGRSGMLTAKDLEALPDQ